MRVLPVRPQREYVLGILEEIRGHQAPAAQTRGIDRVRSGAKLKKYGEERVAGLEGNWR